MSSIPRGHEEIFESSPDEQASINSGSIKLDSIASLAEISSTKYDGNKNDVIEFNNVRAMEAFEVFSGKLYLPKGTTCLTKRVSICC